MRLGGKMTSLVSQDLTLALNSLSSAYIIYDLDFNLLKVSDSAARLFGWQKEELIGKNLNEIKKRYLNVQFFDALEATSRDGIKREVIDNGGLTKGITSSSITRIGDVLLVETSDLTSAYESSWRERMKAKQSEDLINSLEDAVLVVDFIDQIIQPNQKCIEVFGDLIKSESTFFATLFNLPPIATNYYLKSQISDGESYLEFLEKFKDVWVNGTFKEELIYRTTDETTAIRLRKMWRWDYEGRPRGVFVTSTDLTALFKAREAAALSGNMLHELVKKVGIWVGIYDENTDELEVTFPDGEQTIQRNFRQNLPEEWRSDFEAAFAELSQSGSATVVMRDNKLNRSIKTTLSYLTAGDPAERRILSISQDITSELESQRFVDRHEEEAHVQQFAQGIAHDFGNVAQSFDGYVKLLRSEVPTERGAEMLKSLEASASRALRIARKVSEIARYKVIKNEPINIIELLDGQIESLQSLLTGEVRLNIKKRDDIDGVVFANQNQIEQILENLVENANRALAGNGNITIECTEDDAGESVIIKVSDDGPAIPKAIAERIFQPFISSRQEENTGLGLYLAHEYLTTCGGEIELENHNKNVVFSLRLAKVPQAKAS